MAKTNDIIENPVVGDKIKFLTTSEDSNGQTLKIEFTCKVGAQGPPNIFTHSLKLLKLAVAEREY